MNRFVIANQSRDREGAVLRGGRTMTETASLRARLRFAALIVFAIALIGFAAAAMLATSRNSSSSSTTIIAKTTEFGMPMRV